jgi:metal-responsive CopG/Arc/MetJ family transcriptional regulator
MKTVVSVSLPKTMVSEINSVVRSTGKPKSEIMVEALRAYLWEERFKKARSRLRAKARAAGLVTDEDVFRAVS